MRYLSKFFNKPRSECLLVLMTFVLLAAIKLGLRLLPFRNLLKLTKQMSQLDIKSFKPRDKVSPSKIVWSVNVATRYMPGQAKCLARALTTLVLMNYYGYSSELCIGVAKTEAGILEAHAWIEYQGKVAIGNLNDLSRFVQLPSFEGVQL